MKNLFKNKQFSFISLMMLLVSTIVIGYFDKNGTTILNSERDQVLLSAESEDQFIDGETKHNEAPGTIYNTNRYPSGYEHNNFPGNRYHTMRYRPGWQHNDHKDSATYTNRYPGDHSHNNAPGSLFHTDYYPPGWVHNWAPKDPIKHTSRSPAPKHLDNPGWWQHTHLHYDGPGYQNSWYAPPPSKT
jgi:hypothetical protein